MTPAGDVLLEHADQVAWRLQLADSQIADLAEASREQVRVGCFPTALAGFMPAAIARLRAAHGDLRVLMSEVTPSTVEERLLSGELDVALSYQDGAAERRELNGAERIDLLVDSFHLGSPQTVDSRRVIARSRSRRSHRRTGSSPRATASSLRHAATSCA